MKVIRVRVPAITTHNSPSWDILSIADPIDFIFREEFWVTVSNANNKRKARVVVGFELGAQLTQNFEMELIYKFSVDAYLSFHFWGFADKHQPTHHHGTR